MTHPMYENLRSIYTGFAKIRSGKFLQEDGFVLAASSSPIAFMNAMLIDEMDSFNADFFESKNQFFKELGNDYLIFLNPKLPSKTVSDLKSYGLEEVGHPFYANEILNLQTEFKSNLHVKEVSSPEDLKIFMDVFFAGFEMQSLEKHKGSVYEAYLEYGFGEQGLKNYIGFDSNAKAVATASLQIHDDFAGFYNVCVLKEERRNNYGFDITSHLFSEAKKQNVKQIGCNSSPEGLPLYKSLGLNNDLANLNCFVRTQS